MSQWILMLALSSSFQTLGPFNDRGTCLDLKAQMLQHFPKTKVECLSITVPQAAQPAPAPKP